MRILLLSMCIVMRMISVLSMTLCCGYVLFIRILVVFFLFSIFCVRPAEFVQVFFGGRGANWIFFPKSLHNFI